MNKVAAFINSFVDEPQPIYLTKRIFHELFPGFSRATVCNILGLTCRTETILGREFLLFTVKPEIPVYDETDESF